MCFSTIAAEIKFHKLSKKLDRYFGEHFDEDQQVIVNSREWNLVCCRWSLENNVKDDMIIMENLIPKVIDNDNDNDQQTQSSV